MNDLCNRLTKSALPVRHFDENVEETPPEIAPVRTTEQHPLTPGTTTELSSKTNTSIKDTYLLVKANHQYPNKMKH